MLRSCVYQLCTAAKPDRSNYVKIPNWVTSEIVLVNKCFILCKRFRGLFCFRDKRYKKMQYNYNITLVTEPICGKCSYLHLFFPVAYISCSYSVLSQTNCSYCGLPLFHPWWAGNKPTVLISVSRLQYWDLILGLSPAHWSPVQNNSPHWHPTYG